MAPPGRKKEKVLILGASFAGLYAAKFLHDEACKVGLELPEITLIDRKNYVLFTAFLPEILSNQVSPYTIMPSVRHVLGNRQVDFRQEEIQNVDLEQRLVRTDRGVHRADRLVLALGAVTNYFGREDFARYGFPYKTMADAIRLRDHVLSCLERANISNDQAERRRLLTFVQAGAGCCGMEVMTELRELVHRVAGRFYRNIDAARDARFVLVEGMERVLPTLEPEVSLAAEEKLRKRGIAIRTRTLVTGAGPGWVELNHEEQIESETLIWVAGIKANPLVAALPAGHDRLGRVVVDEYFRVPEYEGVYAIGDCAACPDGQGGTLAATAQVAVQQGPALARNLVAEWLGRSPKPFRFRYRGDLVSIGSLDAVCCPFGWNVFGLSGWLLFKYVYFSKLPTVQSKVRILGDWLANFLTGPSIAMLEAVRTDASGLAVPSEERLIGIV
jgi:NADH dehydrogenase